MRIERERKLFVGVRIDNKLRDSLHNCPSRDRVYIDGSDPNYLCVMRSAEDSYVGKMIDGGISAAAMDDLKRNVQSILTRVAQARRSDDDVRVFAMDPGDPPPLPVKRSEGSDGAADANDEPLEP